MKIIYKKHNFLLPPLGYAAINILGVWLFVEEELKPIDAKTYNHECIHSPQWKELGYIGYMLWYFIERVIKFVYYLFIATEMSNPKYKDSKLPKLWIVRAWNYVVYVSKLSYRNLSFEREAYANERNLNYLATRKPRAWLKYIYRKGKISLTPSSEYHTVK